MITHIVSTTTTNSLFAVLEYPELRFLIQDRIQGAVQTSGHTSVGVGLYETLSDAIGMGTLWNRLGIKSKDILGCIQCLQSIGESISTSKIMNQLQIIRDVVLRLNVNLGVLDLLMGEYAEESCNLELIVSQTLQSEFDKLAELCIVNQVVAKKMDLAAIEGAATPLMRNGINVIDWNLYTSIGEFLMQSTNSQLWTRVLSQYVGSLQPATLQCINIREFSKGLKNGNKSAIGSIAKLYLASMGFATLFRNGVTG